MRGRPRLRVPDVGLRHRAQKLHAQRLNEMTDFNMWTWNARVFPGIDPLPVRAKATGCAFASAI